MKFSIITAVFNNERHIGGCIKSVSSQTYPDIEHIVIDGASTDETLSVIDKYRDKIAKVLSEPDKGIYYALNKGIALSSGDVIGALHSDDFYANDRVIEHVAAVFTQKNTDSCYGDLQYVSKNNPAKVVRHWKASPYTPGKFKYGWMPPHSTFFVRRSAYEKYGRFNTDFKIAADYELMLRLLAKNKISTLYLPEVMVKMRLGGISNKSIGNLLLKSSEDCRAWRVNELKGGCVAVLLKNLVKIPQFLTSSRH